MTPELLPGNLAPTIGEAGPGPPPRPKLRRSERIPDPGRWATVIPPVLQELIADSEQLAAHRKLVERVEQAASKLAELRAAHKQAVEADRQAKRAFAKGKRAKLPPPSVPAAAEAVEQAERELELLTRQLPASADELLAVAYPHLEAAAAQLEPLVDEDDEEVERHIGEALRLLDERAELAGQRIWLGLCMWESSVLPFNANARGVASSPVAAQLRQTLTGLRDEREQARRRRHEQRVVREMLFNADRSPKPPDGRSAQARRREAERIVRQREGTA